MHVGQRPPYQPAFLVPQTGSPHVRENPWLGPVRRCMFAEGLWVVRSTSHQPSCPLQQNHPITFCFKRDYQQVRLSGRTEDERGRFHPSKHGQQQQTLKWV